jgi:lipopolysaccharide/colanic/teichoic acid biosynthesis glycosyltransferase
MSESIFNLSVHKENELHQTIALLTKRIYPPELRWWEKDDPTRSIITIEAYLKIKRLLDVLIVILTMPLSLSIMLICAALIKVLSPGGPILFKQYRTGKGGARFSIYKFRTMVPNAESLKVELSKFNELSWPDFKISDDPRITKIGKFLRKTSLDELPQVINVLRGEMSLVGPRPTSFTPQTYQLWQTERLDVLPGITGLWQVIGRGSMEFDDRVRLDVAYIQHRSILLDLKILLLTVGAVIQRRGAH